MAQGAKGRSRQADPSGQSTNQTRSEHVKGTGGQRVSRPRRSLRAGGFAGAKQRKVASNERLVGAQEQAWQRQKDQELGIVSGSLAWVTADGEWRSVSRQAVAGLKVSATPFMQ